MDSALGQPSVLFEDNHLLVIDKPAGWLSQSAERGDDHLVRWVEHYLREKYQKPGNVFVGLVHRLDRMTSGVMVFARTSKAAERLSRMMRERRFDKHYLAIVSGDTPEVGRFEDVLVSGPEGSRVAPGHPEGKRCDLSFARLAVGRDPATSLLDVVLGTGRKHQIRVQLAAHGHPVIGDRRYGLREHDRLVERVALHAWWIALTHPVRGDELRFEAPIPKDFEALMRRCGLVLKPTPS